MSQTEVLPGDEVLGGAPTDVDELQDLSEEDAQELRAFVEKRKWFEGKLTILTSAPPIHPFLHPILVELDPALKLSNNSLPYRHQNAIVSKWKLPSKSQVAEWKIERDGLEDEVIKFDGGDLGRMKEKTMAATLLPLTPPSTHLVSITLALILLIDKLLTLLRHRMELLELMSLRLQWDDLRWEIMEETRKIRSEIEAIVRGKGKWEPPEKCLPALGMSTNTYGEDNHHQRKPSVETMESPPTPKTPSNRPDALARDVSSPSRSGASTSSPSPMRRSLQLPLLHSHLLNLKIRHKYLTTTTLARTGALLDRMIDVAGPLKGLGGVDGPLKAAEYSGDHVPSTPQLGSPRSPKTPQTTNHPQGSINDNGSDKIGGDLGGAIPDLLLDLQDELDADVEEVGRRVHLCQELENQWTSADTHYTASDQARKSATDLVKHLAECLNRPASSQTYAHLSVLLESACSSLPRRVDHNFPRPPHSAYPEIEQHTSIVIRTLNNANRDAELELNRARDWLDWYASLLKARQALVDQEIVVKNAQMKLDQASKRLYEGEHGVSRPIFDQPDSLLNLEYASWLKAIPHWLESAEGLVKEAGDAGQRSTLSILKFRQITSAPPRDLKLESEPYIDDLDESLETEADNLLAVVRSLSSQIVITRQDAQIAPVVTSILAALKTVKLSSTALREDVQSEIDMTSWSPANDYIIRGDKMTSLGVRLKGEAAKMENDIANPLGNLDVQLREQSRALHSLRTYLHDHWAKLQSVHDDSCCRYELLTRIRDQTQVVRQLEMEAQALIERMSVVNVDLDREIVTPAPESIVAESVSETSGPLNSLSTDVAGLEEDILEWQSRLSSRVVFVSDTASESSLSSTSACPSNAGAETAPAMTKPSTMNPLLPSTTSASIAPITPPGSPQHMENRTSTEIPVSQSVSPDLEALDQSVRAHVNDLSAKVSTRVSNLWSKLERARRVAWSHALHSKIIVTRKSLDGWTAEKLRIETVNEELRDAVSAPSLELSSAEAYAVSIEAHCEESVRCVAVVQADLEGSSRQVEAVWEGQDPENSSKLHTMELIVIPSSQTGQEDCAKSVEGEIRQLRIDVETAKTQMDGLRSSLSKLKEDGIMLVDEARSKASREKKIEASDASETIPNPEQALDRDGVKALQGEADVFGPQGTPRTRTVSSRSAKVASPAPTVNVDYRRQIRTLAEELQGLKLDLIVFPPPTVLASSPSTRLLPTVTVAKGLKERLGHITQAVASIPLSHDHSAGKELIELQNNLTSRQVLVPRLDLLASFAQQVESADHLFSNLLDSLDTHGHGDLIDHIDSLQSFAAAAIARLKETSALVETDRRVSMEMKRILRSWAELSGLIEEALRPDHKDGLGLDDDGCSEIETISRSASVMSITSIKNTSKQLPQVGRVGQSHLTTRSVSSPIASRPRRDEKLRDRVVSETPSRTRTESMLHTSQIPRVRKDSLGPGRSGVLSPVPTRPGHSSIPRSTAQQLAGSATPRPGSPLPSRQRKPSIRGRVNVPIAPPRKSFSKTAYVSDPKNKLDVAVGHIVNKLKVDVPIVPVGLNSAGDEWKDQSGRYWIGAEGRAKLCFCRILRSKTVMVRVGGGWVELSKFLLDHFADTIGSWQTPFEDPTISNKSNAPIVISSTTLASASMGTAIASQISPHPETPRSVSAALPDADGPIKSAAPVDTVQTPIRGLPTSISASSLLSATSSGGYSRSISTTSLNGRRKSSATTPINTNPNTMVFTSPGGLASPGGGLIPLHFMKKASESPEAREKEKEGLKVGRRSILGRDGI